MKTVYSSPLVRARQTAEALAKPHGLEVEIVEEIQEVDVGLWEGRSWVEISKSEPERYRQFIQDPDIHGYRNGENMKQVLQRALPAFERLGEQNLGAAIAVVAHNVVNRVILSQILGLPLKRSRTVNQDNAGISILRYRDGAMKLLTLNSTFHLAAAHVSRPGGSGPSR